MNVYAANVNDVIGTIAPGPFGELNFTGIASWAVQLFFVAIGMVALVFLLQGAFEWISSGGEDKKIGEARKRITSAALGLAIAVVLFIGWTFLVGPLLGVFKNGLINIPTINSMCKRPNTPAANINECCSQGGGALVLGNCP